MVKVTLELPDPPKGFEYTGGHSMSPIGTGHIIPTLQPIRWRAAEGEFFYYVNNLGRFGKLYPNKDPSLSDQLWELGNYYRTRNQAMSAATAIRLLYKNQDNT